MCHSSTAEQVGSPKAKPRSTVGTFSPAKVIKNINMAANLLPVLLLSLAMSTTVVTPCLVTYKWEPLTLEQTVAGADIVVFGQEAEHVPSGRWSWGTDAVFHVYCVLKTDDGPAIPERIIIESVRPVHSCMGTFTRLGEVMLLVLKRTESGNFRWNELGLMQTAKFAPTRINLEKALRVVGIDAVRTPEGRHPLTMPRCPLPVVPGNPEEGGNVDPVEGNGKEDKEEGNVNGSEEEHEDRKEEKQSQGDDQEEKDSKKEQKQENKNKNKELAKKSSKEEQDVEEKKTKGKKWPKKKVEEEDLWELQQDIGSGEVEEEEKSNDTKGKKRSHQEQEDRDEEEDKDLGSGGIPVQL